MQINFLSNRKDSSVYRLVLLNSGNFERQCQQRWTKQLLHNNQMKKSKSKIYLRFYIGCVLHKALI